MAMQSVSIAVTGSGGSGVMTAGQLLLDAAAGVGWYGVMTRSFGPQIRGGEAAALIRLADEPVQGMDDAFDLLLGLDWGNFHRFASEIPLHRGSLIVSDPASGPVPELLTEGEHEVIACPLADRAKAVAHGRANMVALGVLGELIGLPVRALTGRVRQTLERKGPLVRDAALEAVDAGFAEGARARRPPLLTGTPPQPVEERWNMSGNEAAGLGALRAGVRFVAAYPITPATDILEWLAARLPARGGVLLQAEDELAAINMCIGASFGGVPSLTATSGPGLSLMTE
ncbi:MAG TPA: 2-oxoacid:acceptor oxidoreductase family protein, partial [Gammaproteobacteria bacterium]|nr:2-oxoacid:acceptor oxidoreductase family protein [Gammaproteobacteria bacterium]